MDSVTYSCCYCHFHFFTFHFLKICVLWSSRRKRRVKWNVTDNSINVCLAFKSWGVDQIIPAWTFSIWKSYGYLAWCNAVWHMHFLLQWKSVGFSMLLVSYSIIDLGHSFLELSFGQIGLNFLMKSSFSGGFGEKI